MALNSLQSVRQEGVQANMHASDEIYAGHAHHRKIPNHIFGMTVSGSCCPYSDRTILQGVQEGQRDLVP